MLWWTFLGRWVKSRPSCEEYFFNNHLKVYTLQYNCFIEDNFCSDLQKQIQSCSGVVLNNRKSYSWLISCMSKTKRKENPKIDRSYQFGNDHSTTGNNTEARWELGLTLIMRPVCQGTRRTGSGPCLCLLG